MFKDVAQSLDSGLLPIIGLIAFFIAFTLILIWAFTMKKEARQAAKELPLKENDGESHNTNNNSYVNG